MKNNVRTFRKQRGYTIEQLAEKAELHRTTIINLEQNRGNPTAETQAKLAKALNCSIADLIDPFDND